MSDDARDLLAAMNRMFDEADRLKVRLVAAEGRAEQAEAERDKLIAACSRLISVVESIDGNDFVISDDADDAVVFALRLVNLPTREAAVRAAGLTEGGRS